MNVKLPHELDPEGQLTLEVISRADRFNRWMFETIEPFCSGEILEAGSGIGNISRFFIEAGYPIALSDIRSHYCDYLRETFSGFPNLKSIYQLDLVEPGFENNQSSLREKFDTIFSLNVVEHIEDDHLAIRNARYLLKKGGNLIILVPAFNFLYNQLDKTLGHYRRYSRQTLENIFIQNQLRILHSQYFNLAGIPGWFVSGKLQKNKSIPGSQMKLYNHLVPVFKIMDKLVFNRAGLSVIAVGRK